MHIPVLKDEVIRFLNPQANENFIDATFCQGGYATAILMKNGPEGRVLGIEVDPVLYEKALNEKKGISRLLLINSSYTKLEDIVKRTNFYPVHGIVFDLGVSSWHFQESGRGFSFQKSEKLDMRYDPRQELSAFEIVNRWSADELEEILKRWGEERFSRRISRMIVEERKKQPIETTCQLSEIISKAVPAWYRRKRIHCATRTFQALRIAVNNELENASEGIKAGIKLLVAGGRIVVVSFHSLEDRIAKYIFKEKAAEGILKILTKKPVCPSESEIQKNPSSRSAKLRAAVKL